MAVYQASYGLNPLVPSTEQPVPSKTEGSFVAQDAQPPRDKVREHFDEFDDDEEKQHPASSSRDKKKQKTATPKDTKDPTAKGQEKKKAAEPPGAYTITHSFLLINLSTRSLASLQWWCT